MPRHRTPAQIDRKNFRGRLRKRARTLFDKAHEMHTVVGAEVYLVVYHHAQFHVYTSTNNTSWPPPLADIKMTYPLPVIHTAEGIKRLEEMRSALNNSNIVDTDNDGDDGGLLPSPVIISSPSLDSLSTTDFLSSAGSPPVMTSLPLRPSTPVSTSGTSTEFSSSSFTPVTPPTAATFENDAGPFFTPHTPAQLPALPYMASSPYTSSPVPPYDFDGFDEFYEARRLALSEENDQDVVEPVSTRRATLRPTTLSSSANKVAKRGRGRPRKVIAA